MDAEEYAADVGAQVRAARAARGQSLSALAAQARIGKGSLSEIETGRRNPTLSTLYALANALDVPLARLLAERSGSELSSPGITARLLESDHQADGATVEVYTLLLAPGHLHRSEAHPAGVTEHLYLTSGRARVGPLGALRVVRAGGSRTWPADTAHGYEALDGQPARGVLTILTPVPD